MMEVPIWFWAGFIVFVLASVVIDLGIFHKKSHIIKYREAFIMVLVWVLLAALFAGWVFYYFGAQKGLEFTTGYLIELSLSMDNVFIIALIFTYFRVPPEYQHRVLMWGIIGALIMRGLLIGFGAVLVKEFQWILYVFGAFLVFTGLKMVLMKDKHEFDPEKNLLVRLCKLFVPVAKEYHNQKFLVSIDGKRHATPLLITLLLIESADLMFAVDSVPAIFAITSDPFIVFTSNVFAILGLRSMYFLLSGVIPKFHYLKLGLCIILVFVGLKMLFVKVMPIPTSISLFVIAITLGLAVLASIQRSRKLQNI